jgi:hypothetical protein
MPGSSRSYEYANQGHGTTLWYHDHAMDHTGRNIHVGLAGLYLIEDEAEQVLNLPAQMIRNAGRCCRRFILLDLVRRIPLILCQIFLAPVVSPITAADGKTSIRRACTPRELSALVTAALAGTQSTFKHSVSLFRTRQVIDISYIPE